MHIYNIISTCVFLQGPADFGQQDRLLRPWTTTLHRLQLQGKKDVPQVGRTIAILVHMYINQ